MKHPHNPYFGDSPQDPQPHRGAGGFPGAEPLSPAHPAERRDLAALDGDTYPLVRPGLILKDFGHVSVIFDSVTSEKLKLSRDSARLLLLCDGKRTVPEICAEYGRTALDRGAPAASQARQLLEDLFERGVLLPGRTRKATGRIA